MFSGENNPAYGKKYRSKLTHPDWAKNISDTATKRQINFGDANGMKGKEARRKVSVSHSLRLEDPANRKILSDQVKKAWKDGKYDSANIGRCKWYTFQKSDGSVIKVQGTWEWSFAKWLDENDMNFKAHVGYIEYIDDEGHLRSYYPDFWVDEWNCYVDTKSEYFESLQKRKLEIVMLTNDIKILSASDLKELGVVMFTTKDLKGRAVV